MLLGFVGEIGFRKKRIPDMLLLLGIGILIHYSGIIPQSFLTILRDLLGFVGTVALTLIVFGGVLKLDIERFGVSVSRGIVIALADLLIVMGLLTPFLFFVLKIPLMVALLLSSILSATAAPFIIPLMARIGSDEKLRHTIEIETIFNSVLNVIATLLILDIVTRQSSILGLTGFLFGSVSEAIVLGGVVGVVWLIVLKQASTPHYYVATVAILLVLWGVSDYLNASAILSVFIFSVIIANSIPLSKVIKISGTVNTEQLDVFNQEITFIVLTFFYVYVGILVNIFDFQALMLAAVLVAVLAVLRFIEIYSVNGATKWFGKDALLISTFIHRGPTQIVLLGITIAANPSISTKYGNTLFYIVILTMLVGSIMFSLVSRRYLPSGSMVQPAEEASDQETV